MRHDYESEGPSFSDEEVREILRRAAELEVRTARTSLSDLVQSAADAGISAELVRRAAAELISAREAGAQAPPARAWTRLTRRPRADRLTARFALGGAALGAMTGVLELFVPQHSLIDVPSFVVLVMAGVVIWERSRAADRSAIGDLAATLIGYGTGWAIVNLEITADLLTGLTAAAVISATIAALHLRVRRLFKAAA